MGVVLPFAPVREVHVFWDFDFWRVTLVQRGQRTKRIGTYADLTAARRRAERLREFERIPTPPVVRPRERLSFGGAS